AGLAVASAPRHALGKGRWPARSLPWLATLVGVVAGLGMLGAWDELAALLDGDALDPATSLRLRMMAGSLPLLDLAPITGIGRGAFGDVFAAFDPEPSAVWISHLECAPLAMLVEWGLVGGVLLVALPAWWISAMRGAGRHDDATARRIVLLGLLALAMQGLADFSLEFLGVAAPACALAGALSPMRPGPSLVLPRTPIVGLLVLALPAPLLLPSSWAALSTRDDLDRAPATDAEVAARPLHASLHRRRARAALALSDWDTARTRAQAAVRLRPAVVDGWLLLAAAERGRGEPAAERRATTEALQCLHHRASPELVRYLVERHEPDELARVAPAGGPGWSFLVEGLLEHAPRHADALARARTAAEPLAPEPLRVLVEANLALERPALALHHARLWRQLEPTDVHAHLAVVRALEHHEPIRPAALREALQRALDEADLDEPALRGLVEEQLIRAMLRERAPGDEARLAELARALRTRPADDQTRRRRLALVDPLLRP
ncbi:MAG: O-antigen ligase family protein, partial [Myxococcales bacterium]|nr:O-antigen ligase family protein [Myxococcales bacterium]